jgi:hypothetical protein
MTPREIGDKPGHWLGSKNTLSERPRVAHYYSNYDAGRIKDRKLLREIRESGLEQELRETILASVQSSVFAKRGKDQIVRDVFEANLLDDEALPVLDVIF